MSQRILLISKDPELVSLFERFSDEIMTGLEREAEPLAGLRRAATRWYPLVVVDGGLPGMKPFDVCRTLRRDAPHLRLLMCTPQDDEFGRVLGLELGADDAVSRPFVPRELFARARALLRRAFWTGPPDHPANTNRLRFGTLEVDPVLQRVTRDSVRAPLRGRGQHPQAARVAPGPGLHPR